MYFKCLTSAPLFKILFGIDCDLAEKTKKKGCPNCGGRLHQAHYGRKSRGSSSPLPEEVCKRLGLCCGREGCRKRVLPPSCLFFGRKVYWGAIILFVVALKQRQLSRYNAAQLRERFGVSKETIQRWIDWFCEEFPKTDRWRRLRGLVSPSVQNNAILAGLLKQFARRATDLQAALICCLKFLATGEISAGKYG
jgi:hypothetical protein